MNRAKCILLLLPLLYLTSCFYSIDKNIGESSEYSKEEIEDAVAVVENNYKEFLTVGRPITLIFDQEISDRVLKDYSDDYKKELIVLSSDIRTKLVSGALSPLSIYKDYYWILEKDKNSWRIIQGNFLN
ncbi:hypothetical protein A5819_001860 [Enterococcus sp. 7E2_DIV0204]|uniref:hypothetical protein n=1 Tax=unclassified Enterococcus TaxID=2608891 RepID=UPI000A344059|nr:MULTISPECIES: hypothetical protein [unclassified Enterococcus]OTN89368.1 hypothetical protein A5819_001860 [Enterococcus sp. 7E2_DIV0204]OTP51822.1 hypothetical protein A5884_001017 [Enterococcus sp. 7D2_DIV0200]